MTHIPTRQEAYELLTTYTKNPSLLIHAKAVEACMRYYARKHGEDEEKWGIVGLVHDMDWDQFPEEHCVKTREILETANWPEEFIRAIESHAYLTCTEVIPETLLEKTLYAVDELTGLIRTTALIRPSKSVLDVKVKSVKRNWKNKRFAAGVDRTVIERGAEMLKMEIPDLIHDCIEAMKEVAEELELKGNL
ncbi:HD domain-containing protein [Marinifilum sp. N1E240]|uniref:HD domain-containing protein n=1 Tax=Marinifilum sp. N1E240 TaxID=2608082 RepID=UPI00128E0DA0|nr:HD domain-containing protein [Marinifilum sp. N1E240]MPQ47885.1 HD domain-containing protein [Marinifilum sp. N1E240]